jgi:hypothetical protein
MARIPRFTPSTFLGLPPLGTFFKPARPVKRAVTHIEPEFDRKKVAATCPVAPEPLGCGKFDVDKLLAKVRNAPDLATIEWDGDRSSNLMGTTFDIAPVARAANDEDPRNFDLRRRKIRDHYIGARFPGVARGAADLEYADRVIKSARLYFEEDESATALELLELAIEEIPHESSAWLARLEILFLIRDRGGFVEAARAFRQAHPAHDSWTEVERLGRAIAPGEALFGEVTGPRDYEHYGPWPHLPNWIHASWDLTAEVVAADFHRAMSLTKRTPLHAVA